MDFDRICTGCVAENCFLVKHNNKLFIIDPGADASLIINRINERGWQNMPVEVLFTHAHADHIGAAGELAKAFPQAVFRLNEPDKVIYNSADNAFPPYIPLAQELPETGPYQDNADYKVLLCPGHTPGGVSILFEDNGVRHLFSGDTLFAGSIGRTDFEGGCMEDLQKSLKMLVTTLPDDVIVHSGHGPDTTVGNEKKNNFYILDII